MNLAGGCHQRNTKFRKKIFIKMSRNIGAIRLKIHLPNDRLENHVNQHTEKQNE